MNRFYQLLSHGLFLFGFLNPLSSFASLVTVEFSGEVVDGTFGSTGITVSDSVSGIYTYDTVTNLVDASPNSTQYYDVLAHLELYIKTSTGTQVYVFGGFLQTGSNYIFVGNIDESSLDVYHLRLDEQIIGLVEFALSIIDNSATMFDSTSITEIPDSSHCSPGDLNESQGCARFVYDNNSQSGEEFSIDIGNMSTIKVVPPATPVYLDGMVKTSDNTDICAMVLASGQYMFSCNPVGELSLTNLPREQDGTVKRQIYADGFFPNIDILNGSINDAAVMTRSGACPSYNTPYDPGVYPDSSGKRINISGKVLLQNSQTPLCAIVLANGQHMFSCDGSGNYVLNIPLDSNGQFKLQVYADGFAPTIQTFDEFQTGNNVRMARAAECQ